MNNTQLRVVKPSLPFRDIEISDSKNIIVFDIDGCILDPMDRVRMHNFGPQMFDDTEAYKHDVPLPAGIMVYMTLLHNTNNRCIFITQRPERTRAITLEQLECILDIPKAKINLLMEPDECEVPTERVKPYLLMKAGYSVEDVLIVFEDRQCIVNEWRRLGVTVFQTDVGDY